jgi:hypothetical protein
MNVKHIGIMPGAAFVLLFSFDEHRRQNAKKMEMSRLGEPHTPFAPAPT